MTVNIPCTKLPARIEKWNIIGTRKVLCHVDNRTVQRCFAVMVGRLLSNIARQLGDFQLAVELAFETSVQNLEMGGQRKINHFLPSAWLTPFVLTFRWPGLRPSIRDGILRMLSAFENRTSS